MRPSALLSCRAESWWRRQPLTLGPTRAEAGGVAELADGRIESVGESRMRFVCIVGGIEVVPQATIRDEQGTFVARVDFLVRGTNVVLEFDGRVKYADATGRALWDEKRREDRLRALGYVVVRVIWTDLADPMALVARIREAMVCGTGSQPAPARATPARGTFTQPEKVSPDPR
ncbi:hypothetical protein [Ornithinimicrobium cryptoxanthini]|uniref:hypothetical protein n=1 Tax=Ornithinimicrobium cryptoxanthini TaxID=2934161 RepID=UPI00211924EA|nr:hypothetical protein [Ornithinimicrobium cryptoxanthini]